MRSDIVLVSNSSMGIFPNNTLTDFRVRLPQVLFFDPNYRVAITRISFTKSWFNYDFAPKERAMDVILSDSKKPYKPKQDDLAKCRLRSYTIRGYYSPEEFVEMINKCLRDLMIDGTDKLAKFPKYSLRNGFLHCDPGTFYDELSIERRWEVSFDALTSSLLGIDKDPPRPVFLNRDYTDLYVFSDLVFPTVVGDRMSELMCIVDGQSSKAYGTHCTEVFDEPWFQPLSKTSFQEIRIYIRDDAQNPIKFHFGRVVVRLSFRRQDDLR